MGHNKSNKVALGPSKDSEKPGQLPSLIRVFTVHLTLKASITSAADARQRIHMKNQALFSSKDKNEKLKCRLLQFLFGVLRGKR